MIAPGWQGVRPGSLLFEKLHGSAAPLPHLGLMHTKEGGGGEGRSGSVADEGVGAGPVAAGPLAGEADGITS